jgi:2-polyprenyl-6-methoxyphenol hydroxylase-like FAD-dependent oxidoreductase
MSEQQTTCAIVGGGPAGVVAALILARAGVQVTILEKHGDFLRDFRGDTVHPSTLQLLDELGLYHKFTALPQVTKFEKISLDLPDGRRLTVADFTRLPLRHRYLALAPQWDLLNMLAEAAASEPTFTLRMRHEVTGLLRDAAGRVTGVRYNTPDGPGEMHAHLTLVCDGRWSVCRRAAGLVAHEFPVKSDLWWFRLPPAEGAAGNLLPGLKNGVFIGVIPRGEYLQAFRFIRKGADAQMRARGIGALRDEIADALPALTNSVNGLTSMDDVKLLDIRINRLRRWYVDGLLCIGDAAHAMSPSGGVGINLAIQDAVAAATRLAQPLRQQRLTTQDLAAVQRRRDWPARVVQTGQVLGHRLVLDRVLDRKNLNLRGGKTLLPIAARFPQLSVIPAYSMGIGVRPEHAPDFARRTPQPAD